MRRGGVFLFSVLNFIFSSYFYFLFLFLFSVLIFMLNAIFEKSITVQSEPHVSESYVGYRYSVICRVDCTV